jgi:hypothetical protein
MRGPFDGASTGVYQLNRTILSSGDTRTALLFCEPGSAPARTAVSPAPFHGTITAEGGATLAVSGVNRKLETDELVVYNPALGALTPASSVAGVEVAVDAAGRVVGSKESTGGTVIPRGGFVVAASGKAAEWLRGKTTLHVDLSLEPSTAAGKACKPTDIVGAGPLLVRDGKVEVTEEKFDHAVTRHPRTAFAVTKQGHFLFVTVDGRQSSSVGMTLAEWADELLSMGAVEAINLDGGGSTTMVVNGVIRNSPSDRRERTVSDALLIYSIPDLKSLAALAGRLDGAPVDPAQALRALGAAARALAGR